VKLSSKTLKSNGFITASVQVTNAGSLAGKEIVQLYIRDMAGSITRPVKELKGFKKINLQPGETQTVDFRITVNDLKFYNNDLKYVAEPGAFKVFIGTNARDVKEESFTLLK